MSEAVLDIYRRHGGDLTKVAAEMGLSYSDFVAGPGAALAPPPPPAPRRRPPPDDLGATLAPDRKYIVSRRHAENPHWPKEDQTKIEKARANYEAGTHEMITGRDREWFILYSIPRANRTGARKFFAAHH